MRKQFFFCFSLLLALGMIAQAAEIRILPNKLNPNGNKARMKAEIRDVDGKSVELSGITLNGVAPLKTRAAAKKVIAFFPKSDVIATLGDVKKGDVVTLSLSFTEGQNVTPTVLTDEVTITGKKKAR